MSFSFPEICVVEASAGSGKTFSLAKRYVQLLLSEQNVIPAKAGISSKIDPCLRRDDASVLKSILAITFTNKAAYEMKQRILLFLKKIAFATLSDTEEKVLLSPIGLTAAQAQPRAQEVMQTLIGSYHYFQVQTIDSFINAILTGCSFPMEMGAQFHIQHNAPLYLEQALDRLIDQAPQQPNVEKVLSDYLHQYLFIENRSSWFPKKELLALVVRLFQQSNTYGLPFKTASIDSKDLVIQKKTILNTVKALRDVLPEGAHAGFVKSLNQFIDRHPESFDVDALSDYFARDLLPLTKSAMTNPDAEVLWDQLHKEVRQLCEAEAFSSFNAYIHVYQCLFDEFRALAKRDDVIFLEELNHRARSLFHERQVSVEELYYRLANRFRHYLIDEFQDTSQLQWMNLKPLIEEGLSSGGSLFYVGDKKQAIYSFRGGDVSLFDGLTQDLSVFPVKHEQLEHNYRSRPEIVEFNNQLFDADHLLSFLRAIEEKDGKIAFSKDDQRHVLQAFAGAKQQSREDLSGGYVHVTRVTGKRKEERQEKIARLLLERIKLLTERFALGDMAILTRNNHEVEEVTSWLMQAGYVVDSERTSDIRLNRTIQELISFLRFLNDPTNNVLCVDWITSHIFEALTDVSVEERHAFVFSLRQRLRTEKGVLLSNLFAEAFPDVWEEWVAPFIRDVGLYPLYELISSIVNRFDLCARFPDDQAFIMHFCELIKANEDEYSDLSSFLEYFDGLEREEVYLSLSDANAIHVLTVHKSKGLEYPVVIAPFLGMQIQVGAGRGDGHAAFTLLPHDEGAQLVRLKNKYATFSPTIKAIHDQEFKKALLSELNNVYVALTRATSEMYLMLPEKMGSGFNLAQLFIPEDVCELGSVVEMREKVEHQEEVLTIPSGKSHHWIEFLYDEFQDDSYVASFDGAHYGEVIHAMLAQLKYVSLDGVEKSVRDALAFVQETQAEGVDWALCEQRLGALLSHDDWREFFDFKDDAVHCEYSLVDRFGQTYRLDRLMIGENELIILDYKTGEPEEAHHDQVKRYVDVVRDIYPDKAVRAYLGYVDALELVEVTGDRRGRLRI